MSVITSRTIQNDQTAASLKTESFTANQDSASAVLANLNLNSNCSARCSSINAHQRLHSLNLQSQIEKSATDSPPSAMLLDSSQLKQTVEETLIPDAQGEVHEEELQYAVALHLLKNLKAETAEAFKSEFTKQLEDSLEDATRATLSALVAQGVISKRKAELINGASFQAAQLDHNTTALYDARGSADDPTIAVASIEQAIAKATSALDSFVKGSSCVSPRPIGQMTYSNTPIASSISQKGFLWKPRSESNGNLVVLLPPNLRGEIVSTEIHTGVPASANTLLERGNFSGDRHNGRRPHYRFDRPGASYPNGVYIVSKLKDGREFTFQIGDPSKRNEVK